MILLATLLVVIGFVIYKIITSDEVQNEIRKEEHRW